MEYKKAHRNHAREQEHRYLSFSIISLEGTYFSEFIKLKLEIFYFQNFMKLQIIMSRT